MNEISEVSPALLILAKGAAQLQLLTHTSLTPRRTLLRYVLDLCGSLLLLFNSAPQAQNSQEQFTSK